jgi:hypothetical protein
LVDWDASDALCGPGLEGVVEGEEAFVVRFARAADEDNAIFAREIVGSIFESFESPSLVTGVET